MQIKNNKDPVIYQQETVFDTSYISIPYSLSSQWCYDEHSHVRGPYYLCISPQIHITNKKLDFSHVLSKFSSKDNLKRSPRGGNVCTLYSVTSLLILQWRMTLFNLILDCSCCIFLCESNYRKYCANCCAVQIWTHVQHDGVVSQFLSLSRSLFFPLDLICNSLCLWLYI